MTMIQPQCDTFEYRIITLDNGLRAILVSDPETDKAAASLDVRVGSMLDPPHLQGLAHFTEHMLFYSSEKYPVEDEYSKFVSDHGGHTNAYTAAEDTNYQFDVNWQHLEPTLDRFAQFFITPLISADGVEREIKAVDSEHSKNTNTDAWRQHQLAKHTANPDHPWAKFFTGNAETLSARPTAAGVDVRSAVAEFHAANYSSNLMRLAVLGRQTLDELEGLVRTMFGPVLDRGLPVPRFPEDVYTEQQLRKLLRVVPVRDGHVLQLEWDVPPTMDLYRQAPSEYLSHLLGHEGQGSVFALLKARGWASALSAGESGGSLSSRSFFYVRIDLTDAGHAHAREVAAVVFDYINILHGPGGISHQVWEEIRSLQELRFNWRDKLAPYSYVTSLSSAMQHYDDEHLLLAMYHVPLEYDPAAIRATLECLTPRRVRIYWASKAFEPEAGESAPPEPTPAASGGSDGWETEPWYGTRFRLEDVPEEWLAGWEAGSTSLAGAGDVRPSAPAGAGAAAACAAAPGGGGGDGGDARRQAALELHLPAPNPFIPTEFGLRAAPGGPGVLPRVLEDSASLRLLHAADLRFGAPKAVVYLDFQCPEAYSSPSSSVLTRLFVKLLAHELNEHTYPAELAGLAYHCHNTLTGFQIVASGYSHKLPLLLKLLLDKVAVFSVDADRFQLVRESLAKEYANVRFQQPYQWAMYRSELLLNLRRWRVEDYQLVISGLGPSSLTAFLPDLLGRCRLEALVTGNMDAGEAKAVADTALAALRGGWRCREPYAGESKDLRTMQVPAGVACVLSEPGPNPADDNSAALVTFQVGPDDLHRNALAQLLVQLGKRDAFHTLRTQQQLGYIVFMFGTSDLAVHAISLVVQGNSHPAEYLAARIDAFLLQLMARLRKLPQDEFDKGVAELAAAKLEKPKRLGELSQRWWTEVYHDTLEFERQVLEVEALRRLSLAELVAFAEEVVGNPEARRKLTVLVRGSGNGGGAGAGLAAAAGDAAPAAGAEEAKEGAAGQEGDGVCGVEQRVLVIDDIGEFKRGCGVWPGQGAAARLRRRAVQVRAPAPLHGEGSTGLEVVEPPSRL